MIENRDDGYSEHTKRERLSSALAVACTEVEFASRE